MVHNTALLALRGTATSTATGLVAAINAGISANSITNFTVTDGLDGSFTINSVAGSEAPVVTELPSWLLNSHFDWHLWPRYTDDWERYTADALRSRLSLLTC